MRPLLASLMTLVLVTLTSVFASEAMAQGTAVLLPLRGTGADANARRAAETSLRRRLEVRGYQVEVLTEGVPGAGASPAELGELARSRGAAIVVDPTLEEFAGETSLRIRIISPAGSVLGENANLSTATSLPQDAATILAVAMESLPETHAPPESGSGVEAPWDVPSTGRDEPTELVERPRAREDRPRPRRPRRQWQDRRWWLGAQIEPAMGTNRNSFNLLVGARGEFQWRGLTVALNFQYTFVRDWEPRTNWSYHTLAIYGLLGYQIRLGSDRLKLPLMIGAGYIPGNGALLRIEAGLAIKATDRIDIRVLIVCPNFWFLENEMVLFTSLSLGLLFGF